jgi:hypothetical protein
VTRHEWLDVALKVLGGAVGLLAAALAIRVVSDDLGLMFLYASGLATLVPGDVGAEGKGRAIIVALSAVFLAE